MKKNKIVFLCHFSNPLVRNNLELKSFVFRNYLAKFLHRETFFYDDFAIWVSDYIDEFKNHAEMEFHVVSPHKGMVKKIETFESCGIHYHFYKCDGSLVFNYFNTKFRLDEKNDFRQKRATIKRIINEISPNLILLCGAENPYYSTGVLDVNGNSVYVILQTLLNDSKRIKMGIGSHYRRKVELDVFRHAHYFCATENNAINKIKEVNSKAVILPVLFPTHRPIVSIPKTKEYDFVFFSRIITANKGIEDLLHAIALVTRTYKKVSLNVIGGCELKYRERLDGFVEKLGIKENVHFAGYYENINDTYNNVAKAKVAILPGITASLNSTVRESMLLGLPTICYTSSASERINKDNKCLITAKVEDVEDLAKQMLYVLDYPEKADIIAKNGMDYANHNFSNKAIVNALLENCCKIISNEV